MKLHITVILLLVASSFIVRGRSFQQSFDKNVYYTVMAAENTTAVDKQIKIVQESSVPSKEAYEGALLMKKAGLAKNIREKLNLFKSGHKKLEACIKTDEKNVELHFLRLIIQEHAPGILNYKGDLERDKEYIQKSFKGLSPDIQKFITDYSKHSKILNPKDFNFDEA